MNDQQNEIETIEEYNESIISQLITLGLGERDDIINAMNHVVDKNDINEITEYLSKHSDEDKATPSNPDEPNENDGDDDGIIYVMENGRIYVINAEDAKHLKLNNDSEDEAEKQRKREIEKQKEEEEKAKQEAIVKQIETEELEQQKNANKHEEKSNLIVYGFIRNKNNLNTNDSVLLKIFRICLSYYYIDYTKLNKLTGNKFINKKSEIVSFEQVLNGKDLIAFYFSAKWCPPSFEFTPKLAAVHAAAIEQGIKFQIVFISSDRSKEAMMDYFLNYHGNYIAIEYENEFRKQLLCHLFHNEYIPQLVIMNGECELIDGEGRKTVSIFGTHSIELWNLMNMNNAIESAQKKAKEEKDKQEQNGILTEYKQENKKIVYGYIHSQIKIIGFEWILPSQIMEVCFKYYFNSIEKLLKLVGNEFIKQNGENVNFRRGVEGYDLIGFYFSGIWCPPSAAFTPKLKQVYDAAINDGYKLQIIFISSDKSKEDMMNYFKNHHADYLAIDFDDTSRKQLLKQVFENEYIPQLCIVNDQCKLLDENARNTVESHGSGSIKLWDTLKQIAN